MSDDTKELRRLIKAEFRELEPPEGSVDRCLESIKVASQQIWTRAQSSIELDRDQREVELAFTDEERRRPVERRAFGPVAMRIGVGMSSILVLALGYLLASGLTSQTERDIGPAPTTDGVQALKTDSPSIQPASSTPPADNRRSPVEEADAGRAELRRTVLEPPTTVGAKREVSRTVISQAQGPFDDPTPAKNETSPHTSVNPADLKAEMSLIRSAKSDIAHEQYGPALKYLKRHARRFPRGIFAEERDFLKLVVACRRHREHGYTKELEAFGQRYPNSVLLAKLDDDCLR